MKQFSRSESLGALVSICPPEEGDNPKDNQGYSSEFQAMLDSLEREDSVEETITQKKRRLSLDQVKALEKNFKLENKIEPGRKTKLAEELGLQPRQVAIWFQNRRARWKTKQLEKDYGILKADYDSLKLDFDNLERQKEALKAELSELKMKLLEENENCNNSVKEEALFSESENNVSEQSKISPSRLYGGSESTSINPDFCNIMGFKGLKEFQDGSSESDSSGIWKAETNLNHHHHQLLISPSSSTSSLRFNSTTSPPPLSMNYLQFSEVKAIAARAYQQQFGRMEEQSFFGTEEPCNFFSVDQPPTLHCYVSDQLH